MNKIEFGDCRDTMRKWISNGVKVQTCVTSPPYYGLRDYGVNGQLGLEETPEEYIKNMVEVFSCVKDLLADDGTLWVNIGDSYAANRTYQVPSTKGGKHSDSQAAGGKGSKVPEGLKPKDMIGIPWMLAFALRADGWYLRQDIIWHKPNAMPESVTDRCTKSHEYIFLLSKSQTYYFDNDVIREPFSGDYSYDAIQKAGGAGGIRAIGDNFNKQNRQENAESTPKTRADRASLLNPLGRNKRSVWTVNTKPYAGAHFAVFPDTLITPCILAGSRKGDIVLDPFMGSGTTAAVAKLNDRKYLGCELNIEYKILQDERIDIINPLEEFFA